MKADPNHPVMPPETRQAFERFTRHPPTLATKHDIILMLQYICSHDTHSVYCKVKEFMPRHHKELLEQARQRTQ